MQYSIVASDLSLFPEGFQADEVNLIIKTLKII